MVDLRNAITKKEIPKNKNLNKIVDIVENTLGFRSLFKILTPKQMLQRLPIALAQVETGNTFEHLLNEIRQILCIEQKELLKKYITI